MSELYWTCPSVPTLSPTTSAPKPIVPSKITIKIDNNNPYLTLTGAINCSRCTSDERSIFFNRRDTDPNYLLNNLDDCKWITCSTVDGSGRGSCITASSSGGRGSCGSVSCVITTFRPWLYFPVVIGTNNIELLGDVNIEYQLIPVFNLTSNILPTSGEQFYFLYIKNTKCNDFFPVYFYQGSLTQTGTDACPHINKDGYPVKNLGNELAEGFFCTPTSPPTIAPTTRAPTRAPITFAPTSAPTFAPTAAPPIIVTLFSRSGQSAQIEWLDNGDLSPMWRLANYNVTARCKSPTYTSGVAQLLCGQLDSSTDIPISGLDDVASYTISNLSYSLVQLSNYGSGDGSCGGLANRVSNNDPSAFGNGEFVMSDGGTQVGSTFYIDQSRFARFLIFKPGTPRCS